MTLIGKVVAGIVAGLYGLFMVALPDVTPERPSPVQTTVYSATSTHYSPTDDKSPDRRQWKSLMRKDGW